MVVSGWCAICKEVLADPFPSFLVIVILLRATLLVPSIRISLKCITMDANAPPFRLSLKPGARPFVPLSTGSGEGSALHPRAQIFLPATENFAASSSNAPLCRFFRQGACKKGLHCPFRHDANATIGRNLSGRSEEATERPTIEFNVEDGIHCCFGPGASIIRLDIGECDLAEEIKSIAISGLPACFVNERDVEARLSAYGTLVKLSVKPATHNADMWYAIATFVSSTSAAEAVHALSGTTVKSWIGLGGGASNAIVPPRQKEVMEAGVSLVLQGKKRGNGNAAAVSVKVQWFAPSTCSWIHYSQRWQAEKVAKVINKRTICGRVVEARFQRPSQGQKTSFSVWVGNLPDNVTRKQLLATVGQIAKIRAMSVDINPPSFSERSAPTIVQKLLRAFGPLTAFDVQPLSQGSTSLKRRALARYADALDAKKACDHFQRAATIKELGGGRLFVQRIFSLKYSLPRPVFSCVRSSINDTCSSLDNIRTSFFENRNSWTVLIHADTQEDRDAARARLAPMIEGEVVRDPGDGNHVVWSRRMLSAEYKIVLSRLEAIGASRAWVDV